MHKTKDIETGLSQWEIWSAEKLAPLGGFNHWSLKKHKGFGIERIDYIDGQSKIPMYEDGYGKGPYVKDVQYSVQQVKSEALGFIQACIDHRVESILEIGLGVHGGFHMLLSQFFDNVTTVELESVLIKVYQNSIRDPKYNDIVKNNKLISGDSAKLDISLLNKEYDMIFIDGNHTYEALKNDFHKYYPLCKSGGIMAMHDSHDKRLGCYLFIEELRDQYDLVDIWEPEANVGGISYFVKE
jgi:hypothetical protein